MARSRVLTLKYRPQTFDELWLQDHVKDTLMRAIETGRLANAYLFGGPRGVGKTTTARILAKCLNCEKGPTVKPCNACVFCMEITGSRSLDVLEVDGASNRGIDQIRELRENIKYSPSAARFKVYIIDEVHMLTEQAFNALLKTLEEPPAHAKFVFATTEPHNVPATIISRCQRFDFRRATPAETMKRLAWLAAQERIGVSEAALSAIARRAGGAIRDGESILDQLAAYKPEGIEVQDVEELLGVVPAELFFDYTDMLRAGDAAGLLRLVDRLFESGYDPLEFLTGLVEHFRNLLLTQTGGPPATLGLLEDEAKRLAGQAEAFGREGLIKVLSTLMQSEESARRTQLPRVLIEVLSLELAGLRPADADVRGRQTSEQALGTPDASARRPAAAQDVWAEFRLRINTKKPMLASMLDLATPSGLRSGTLDIVLPGQQAAAARHLRDEQRLLDSVLTTVVGEPTRLGIHVARQSDADPVKEKITKFLGEVDE